MSVFSLQRHRGQRERATESGVDASTVGTDGLTLLLQRAGRGDEAAFGQLYDELAGLINGVVRNVVRDPSQSDEVTQEVFIELWRLAPRFDDSRGSVKSWAVTIAHRRAIDRVRSEQASRDRMDRESAKRIVEYDTVTDAVETTFEQVRVRRALHRLTDAQREAVELAYFGGLTYREVAILLDVAEGTVKSRIRDGMIRLRDELGASA